MLGDKTGNINARRVISHLRLTADKRLRFTTPKLAYRRASFICKALGETTYEVQISKERLL